jgi:hypothetical protein
MFNKIIKHGLILIFSAAITLLIGLSFFSEQKEVFVNKHGDSVTLTAAGYECLLDAHKEDWFIKRESLVKHCIDLHAEKDQPKSFKYLSAVFAYLIIYVSLFFVVKLLNFMWNLMLAKANTPAKRIALLLSPFFLLITVFRFGKDLKNYGWEPSLSFLLFGFLTIASIAIAFTRLLDWISGDQAAANQKTHY